MRLRDFGLPIAPLPDFGGEIADLTAAPIFQYIRVYKYIE
jgi:hypothetical protein